MAYIAAMLQLLSATYRAVVNKRAQAWAPAFVVFVLLAPLPAFAHPEDEFCVPGEPGIDPALCRALAALNSGDEVATDAQLAPLLDESGNQRGFWSTFVLYVGVGVDHILPDGLDHILFVLALFLASRRLRSLVVQITAFTVAHTVTLALAATGLIAPSPNWVEPFIAFTIAFVAIENLVFRDMTWWRPLLVFVFGLIHGLGFAGFFAELGLPSGQFWSALLGFNLGVEVGQLSVVALAFMATLLLRRSVLRMNDDALYRKLVAVPASLAIGAVGLWWTVARIAA